MSILIKKCFKCGCDLPCSDFYQHSQMADGLLGKCKSCTKDDVHLNREKNIDRIREWDRARGTGHSTFNWAKNHPEETRVHRKIQWAVKTGKVKKHPCVYCGSLKSLAHHPNYSKPFEVIWLCHIHHKEIHKWEE